MSNTEMSDGNISQLNRRGFMKLSAAGVVSLAAMELLPEATKSASADTVNSNFEEKYQIFVPVENARWGGSQSVTLRSGYTIKVKIPRRLKENSKLTVKGVGLKGNDVTLICHTLYDPNGTTGDSIYGEINQANFIKKELTKDRCNAIYQSLENGKFVRDLVALDLLDYVMESAKLDEDISQRYSIASNNSRLKGIEEAIVDTLAKSKLNKGKKKCIKGTYQYVRAGEPVPDFAALTDLNAIVAGSNLPEQLKQVYLTASAKSKAVTVDFIIVELIKEKLSGQKEDDYLSVWEKVRNGEKISDGEEKTLEFLDGFIENSDISETSKTLYLLARVLGEKSDSQNDPLQEAIESSNKLTDKEKYIYNLAYSLAVKGESNEQTESKVVQYAVAKFHSDLSEAEEKAEEKDFAKYAKLIAAKLMEWLIAKADIPPTYRSASLALVGLVIQEKDVASAAAALVPTITSTLSVLGAKAGTGVAISSLSGGATTTATLATLGGGSVAAGGLGMLGGLVVVTGGAALIGAAGLLSVALLTRMDGKDYVNLGIAGTVGVLTSATVAVAIWTGAGALGVAGSLSGAAAITTTISALGGLSIMTGGVALIALGTGFAVWSVLKGKKSKGDILKELESRAYMLTEPSDDPLVPFVQKNLPKNYEHEDVYLAPAIPLDKLSNAIHRYGYLDPGEKILALIDTSGNHNAKDGILLTDRKILSRPAYSNADYAIYSTLSWSEIFKVSNTMLESYRDAAKFARFLIKLQEQVQGQSRVVCSSVVD
ncbi:twin-arginine translocation signal domain-containing protein [Dapis sp. BLCC M229]|uniref:twin-arginine translocation signal domain-containing protein n=1 Tax=Dapis sp. BLCC M229 TaxID=3400188 RepID=UPI003CF37590